MILLSITLDMELYSQVPEKACKNKIYLGYDG
jgi:hypothetical protein